MSEDEIVKIGITQNKRIAPFIFRQGFDTTRSAFSSSVLNQKGIVLIELPTAAGDSNRKWQHPSWDDYGYMGAITSDQDGNVYTAPIPVVNTLDNPFSIINRIYKINAETGELKLFSILPVPDSTGGSVPFGVLGIYFDIHSQKLYASSVAGSTAENENGIIYSIDPQNGQIVEEWKGHDIMSLFVGGITGVKKLYMGSARKPEIYSITLSKAGKLKDDFHLELSLEQLGPRGDDKARRIRFDQNGNMNITGVPFNYNLSANANVVESFYLFDYDAEKKQWVYKSVR